MPEGPEVQTVVNVLQDTILNFEIIDLKIITSHHKIFPNLSIDEMKSKLIKQQIIDITRKGKYILILLPNQYYLVIHLGMTGQLLLNRPSDNRYLNLEFLLQFKNKIINLFFCDKRKFGKILLLSAAEYKTYLPFQEMGPDIMEESFSYDNFLLILNSNSTIYHLLLNQKKISGLGNIYVNEALFQAGIYPLRKSNSLTLSEKKKLFTNITGILQQALQAGGTTVSDYSQPNGNTGKFQTLLQVYRKEGQSCIRCNQQIMRQKIGSRSIYYCSSCQRS